jgi:predicted nuclease of predicted toxin-antitoxin system
MKILIDECAPRALVTFLSKHGHECLTVQRAGWSGKQNGELLALAEASFEVFITLDTNLSYQQNLSGRKIGIIVLAGETNRSSDLISLFPACASILTKIRPGQLVSLRGARQVIS